MNRDIWYLLVDDKGDPAFEDVGAYFVSVSTEERVMVGHFTKEVWLQNKDDLLSGTSPARLKVFSNKEDVSDKTKAFKASALVGDRGENEDVPLLVRVPNKNAGVVKGVWKPETRISYSLQASNMFFVNRKKAIFQLQAIHNDTYNRARTGAGQEWVIPLADNILGLGKSDFGRHYITKSREAEYWSNQSGTDEFKNILRSCHTVRIEFIDGDMLDPATMQSAMLRLLVDALKPMFTTQPSLLSHSYEKVEHLVNDLTKEVGPLFIVFDEIGKAFQSSAPEQTDFERRELFFKFCKEIVGKWFSFKTVFFVILGRASFLNYVGLRPTNAPIIPSGFIFKRLSIHLLRADAISDILKNTSYVEGEQSISDKLNLSPPQIATVASNLFLQTNGHPRTILSVLQNCTTFDALLTFKTTLPLELRGLDWNILFEGLARNRVTIVRFLEKMEKNEVMDLTEEVKDAGGRLSTLDAIASNACIAWDGTLEEAELHVHPFVKSHFQNYAMPFKKYIRAIGSITGVSSDYPTVFEWMFLKRFQEMLLPTENTPQLPPSALSPFFDTPLFGKLKAIVIDEFTRKIPKITTTGSRNPRLDADTMHPEEWKNLMPLIDALGCVCLKPLPKSSSSDAFLIGKSLEYPEQRLTVGLAVKNYKSTKFNAGQLDDECHVFNRMFDGVDCKSRKNVLFICSTSYTEDIARKFHSRHCQVYNAAIFPNISEVVLLDLSTPALRALFFGLVVGSDLSVFVENVVKKAEVEFNAELQ